jgi:hypothetical protein
MGKNRVAFLNICGKKRKRKERIQNATGVILDLPGKETWRESYSVSVTTL